MIKTVNVSSGRLSSLLQQNSDEKGNLPNTSRYAWPTDSGRSSSNRSYPSRSSRSSTNSFFTRNSPHPAKVKHIKGLLDVPICTVLDGNAGGSRPTTRFSVTRPNGESDKRKLHEAKLMSRMREKAVPNIGLVPIAPDWKEELHRLTQALNIGPNSSSNPLTNAAQPLPSRQGTRQGTRQGSRQGTRQGSRQASRDALRKIENEFVRNSLSRGGQRLSGEGVLGDGERPKTSPSMSKNVIEIGKNQDVEEANEELVFGLLTQILQTDSVPAIQNWLINAPEREKQIVMDMIKAVSSSDEQVREGLQNIRNPAFRMDGKEPERDAQRPPFDDQLLQHESSVDYDEIRKYNEEWLKEEQKMKKNKPASLLEELNDKDKKGQSYTDYEWSANAAVNKPSTPFKIFEKEKAKPGTEEAVIEEIRSNLASRPSMNVLGPQKTASRLSNRPATQQGDRQKNGSAGKTKQKEVVKTLAPFNET